MLPDREGAWVSYTCRQCNEYAEDVEILDRHVICPHCLTRNHVWGAENAPPIAHSIREIWARVQFHLLGFWHNLTA